MNQILTMSRKVRRDVRGVTAIEYGLLVALIIIACIAALSLTGTNARNVFSTIGHGIENGISTYPNGLPYQGLGIAPPSGTAVYDAATSSSAGASPGYMANGQLYSQVDVANKAFTVYADGFAASASSVGKSTFESACTSGNSAIAGLGGDYGVGTFSVAPNGDYVCGNARLLRVSGGTLQQNVNAANFY